MSATLARETTALAARVADVRTRLAAIPADAVVITRPANIRYLSGFRLREGEEKVAGYSGTLVITGERLVIVTDFRYLEQAEAEARGWDVRRTTKPMHEDLPPIVAELGVRRLALEADVVTHATWSALADAAPDIELLPVPWPGAALRETKTPDEVAAIERACRLGDAAFEFLLSVVRPGMTETHVAWQLERWFRENGAEELAFDPGILAGPRAAMPHGSPNETPIERGNVLLLDFGCQVDGYRSDMTRTVFIGPPSAERRRVYELVLEAQQRALDGIRPGMSGREADALARDFLADAGHGDDFGHSLGHGIGLETHELPRLGSTSDSVLAPGMVFSVEPGVYLPGVTGVRIEDIVVLETSGVRRLTQSPRELLVVD
ncbi:MAG: Xaa-Pro peptidase family protein [Chloroflexota bacterium]|nr:Xaa-Pro peptidase family protein [Chloroflexota bacterium]